MAGGRRPGRGFPLRPVRPVYTRPHGGVPHTTVTTKIPLQWSFTVTSTMPASTVTGDDEDAWSLDLEWAFLIDLDPADDVEGDP